MRPGDRYRDPSGRTRIVILSEPFTFDGRTFVAYIAEPGPRYEPSVMNVHTLRRIYSERV